MLWRQLEKILPQVEKPARYIGDEINAVVKPAADVRVGLAFPDVYEIGTSYLGFQILYDIINNMDGVQAERVFAPWPDMERLMRERGIPLYGLETKTPLAEFDMLGFTLQYELGYTNILNMLDLAGLPLRWPERESGPLVIAGGPGALNPEPLSHFFDAFVIGEGEEVIVEIIELVRACSGLSRQEKLSRLAKVPGVYVPRFYTVEKGAVKPVSPEYPSRIVKGIVKDFSTLPLPGNVVVPHIRPVHDRVSVEVCRGCARGCRFCQAGMAYRPVRERRADLLHQQGEQLLRKTGSVDISLSSLSSADYSHIEELARKFMEQTKASVSLPSLRVDSYSVELARLTGAVRKSGLTLAPEAGTQRLRDVINKNVTEQDLLDAAGAAFRNGWHTIKLYFMLGLPTETREDIAGIVKLCWRLVDLYREINGKAGRLQINLGVSTFVPKPHTPFQWAAQLPKAEVLARQQMLKEGLRHKRFKVTVTSWQESWLEAVLARGDRRVGDALHLAWQKGCKFDAWTEHFRFGLWQQALAEAGVDGDVLAGELCPQSVLPWEHIDIGVSKKFLLAEYERAIGAEATPDCTFYRCSACGVCGTYNVEGLKRGAGK